MEYNGEIIQIVRDELFVGQPGTVLGNIMPTPNADCRVICIRQQPFAHIMFTSKTMWTDLLYIKEHPVVRPEKKVMARLLEYHRLLVDKIPESGTPFYKDIMHALFTGFTYEVLKFLEEGNMPEDSRQILHGDMLYKRFLELLVTHGGQLHSVRELAELQHVSPKYLSAVIKKVSGRNAYDIIRDSVLSRDGSTWTYELQESLSGRASSHDY